MRTVRAASPQPDPESADGPGPAATGAADIPDDSGSNEVVEDGSSRPPVSGDSSSPESEPTVSSDSSEGSGSAVLPKEDWRDRRLAQTTAQKRELERKNQELERELAEARAGQAA